MVVDTVVSKWIHLKHFSPNAFYYLLTNKWGRAYGSTCQHQHKESEYYLPQKPVKVVNEYFDTNQNKSSEILNI